MHREMKSAHRLPVSVCHADYVCTIAGISVAKYVVTNCRSVEAIQGASFIGGTKQKLSRRRVTYIPNWKMEKYI